MELLNLLALPDPAPTVARMAELRRAAGDPARSRRRAALAALESLIARNAPGRRARPAAPPRRAAPARSAARPSRSPRGCACRRAQKKRLVTAADARRRARRCPRARLSPRPRRGARPAAAGRRRRRAARRLGNPATPAQGRRDRRPGCQAGPEVARILRAVEDRWVAEGFPGAERVRRDAGRDAAAADRSARGRSTSSA